MDSVEGGRDQWPAGASGWVGAWWAGAGSLGLRAWGRLAGPAHDPRVLPQGSEQPDLGGEELVIGELEQQLLTWHDKAQKCAAVRLGGPAAAAGPLPPLPSRNRQ